MNCHFAAKDDLIVAAVAEIFDSIKEFLETRLGGTSPETFVFDHITAWVEYYRTQTRYMLAIREIWGNFRDDSGHQHFGPQAVSGEIGVVKQVLEYGQADGSLGEFDAGVMAVTIKATPCSISLRPIRSSTWRCTAPSS